MLDFWTHPVPPPRTSSLGRGPVAAAFDTEMPRRSCSLVPR